MFSFFLAAWLKISSDPPPPPPPPPLPAERVLRRWRSKKIFGQEAFSSSPRKQFRCTYVCVYARYTGTSADGNCVNRQNSFPQSLSIRVISSSSVALNITPFLSNTFIFLICTSLVYIYTRFIIIRYFTLFIVKAPSNPLLNLPFNLFQHTDVDYCTELFCTGPDLDGGCLKKGPPLDGSKCGVGRVSLRSSILLVLIRVFKIIATGRSIMQAGAQQACAPPPPFLNLSTMLLVFISPFVSECSR